MLTLLSVNGVSVFDCIAHLKTVLLVCFIPIYHMLELDPSP